MVKDETSARTGNADGSSTLKAARCLRLVLVDLADIGGHHSGRMDTYSASMLGRLAASAAVVLALAFGSVVSAGPVTRSAGGRGGLPHVAGSSAAVISRFDWSSVSSDGRRWSHRTSWVDESTATSVGRSRTVILRAATMATIGFASIGNPVARLSIVVTRFASNAALRK